MKALRYKIEICDDAMSMIHGFMYDIEEIHIPELNLFANHQNIFVVGSDEESEARIEDAKDIEEFDVSQNISDLAHAFVSALAQKNESEAAIMKVLKLEDEPKEESKIVKNIIDTEQK